MSYAGCIKEKLPVQKLLPFLKNLSLRKFIFLSDLYRFF